MKENYKNQEKIYDAEVLESSTFDENIIIKILIKAGRTIAKPALIRILIIIFSSNVELSKTSAS